MLTEYTFTLNIFQSDVFHFIYRLFPSHMNCPPQVYGVGLSRFMAIGAARKYADLKSNGCGRYLDHCQTKKFIK